MEGGSLETLSLVSIVFSGLRWEEILLILILILILTIDCIQ